MYRLDKHLRVKRNGAWFYVETIRRAEPVFDVATRKTHRRIDKMSRAERLELGIRDIILMKYDEEHYMAINSSEQIVNGDVVIKFDICQRFSIAELRDKKWFEVVQTQPETFTQKIVRNIKLCMIKRVNWYGVLARINP